MKYYTHLMKFIIVRAGCFWHFLRSCFRGSYFRYSVCSKFSPPSVHDTTRSDHHSFNIFPTLIFSSRTVQKHHHIDSVLYIYNIYIYIYITVPHIKMISHRSINFTNRFQLVHNVPRQQTWTGISVTVAIGQSALISIVPTQ